MNVIAQKDNIHFEKIVYHFFYTPPKYSNILHLGGEIHA